MKIAFITIQTPYHENHNGTSGHPYHLIIHRPKDVDLEIYTFNINNMTNEEIKEVEKELNTKIHVVPLPKWLQFILKFHLLFLQVFLKYPISNYIAMPEDIVTEIKEKNPDGIWIYGYELTKLATQFKSLKRVVTLPDSIALYYYRMLGTRFVTNDWKQYLRCAIMYPKFRHLERDLEKSSSICYHLVGDADAKFIRDMAPGINAVFLRHPHYDIYPKRGERHFHSPIRLLIAGQYNYYMKQDADEFIDALLKLGETGKKELTSAYQLTFVGHGWENHAANLRNAGWNVSHIPFADNYIDEITKHDIQLTPISIGTGTKGKVLDALTNGLLVIGTPYAMENIAVENNKSCIIYHSSWEAINILTDIKKDPQHYETIAKNGQEAVLKEHSRTKIASQLFAMFR